MPPMPMPAGPWFLPRRIRQWLTYRRIFSELCNARETAGWPVSAGKYSEFSREARQIAKLTMDVFG